MIERILEFYSLTATRVHERQMGYRNHSYPVELTNGRAINLILYKPEPGILEKIKDANTIAAYLAAQGFPVRHAIHPKIICLRSNTRTRYGALYNYLPGHTIPWEAYTQKHLKLLGATLSGLHAALREHPPLHSHVADVYAPIFDRMARYFARADVQAALHAKLGLAPPALHHYQRLIAASRHWPGQQMLHMDFVRSNLLFGPPGVTLTGIIDFEKTAYGHPGFDIARTLAFLLVDCKYKTPAKIVKYFLHSGYNKRGPANFTNIRLLHELTNLFLLHDFYKFLVHNPYDYLETNEHFVRTRDILASRGLIRYSRRNANAVTEIIQAHGHPALEETPHPSK